MKSTIFNGNFLLTSFDGGSSYPKWCLIFKVHYFDARVESGERAGVSWRCLALVGQSDNKITLCSGQTNVNTIM